MPKTIAVVGAGPQIGFSVAKRFGREGFSVALLARSESHLDELVEQLSALGVPAAGFTADVTDDEALTDALGQAINQFGSIDVLEYSPVADRSPDVLARPRDVTVNNTWHHLDLNVRGAITSVNAVLPGMLERQSGSLLFCGGASSANVVPTHGSYSIAGAGLRSYVLGLAKDLENDGVHAAYVMVAGAVLPEGVSVEAMVAAQPDAPSELDDAPTAASLGAFPVARPDEVADLFWDIHTKRDQVEAYAGDIGVIRAMAAGGSL